MCNARSDGFRTLLDVGTIKDQIVEVIDAEDTDRENSLEKYLLGIHFRHVLDKQAPRVELVTKGLSDIEKNDIDNIKRCMDSWKMETANHVLDSLYYDNRSGRGDEVVIKLKFTDGAGHQECNYREGEAFHVLQDAGNVESEGGGKIVEGCVDKGKIEEALNDFCEGGEIPDLDEMLFGSCGQLYPRFLCGVQELCERLKIHPNMLAYKSIIMSLFQLACYSKVGKNALIVMFRPSDPFDYSFGVTLVADDEQIHQDDYIDQIKNQLGEIFNALNRQDVVPRLLRCIRVPGTSTTPIATNMLEQHPRGIRPGYHQPIICAINSFLDLSEYFCDERWEGRPLRYGLLLGNAALMRYWPGKELINLVFSGSPGRQSVVYIPNLLHLTEGPDEKCIVFPYSQDLIRKHIDLGSISVIDLDEYEEAFAYCDDTVLWSREHRPYAYFTNRYPWAVAAVVGPYSEVRVFKDGELFAYRDGKGWRQLKLEKMRSDLRRSGWSDDEIHRVEILAKIAIQISEYGRNGGHGGYLIYVPVEGNTAQREFWEKFNSKVWDTGTWEPSVGSRGKWITGKNLIKGSRLDNEVARLVLRASRLDGAVVFSGNSLVISGFGKHLNFGTGTGYGMIGTKRGSAGAYIQYMATESGLDEVGQKAFAVTISSDGPIRINYWSKGENRVVETELFGLVDQRE